MKALAGVGVRRDYLALLLTITVFKPLLKQESHHAWCCLLNISINAAEWEQGGSALPCHNLPGGSSGN